MPPRKRRALEFGAPSQEDKPNAHAQLNDPTSAAISERIAPGNTQFPSLVTLSCRYFAAHLEKIFAIDRPDGSQSSSLSSKPLVYVEPSLWRTHVRRNLLQLPDYLLQRLFTVLRTQHPTKLTTAFISEYFMRGDTIRFTGELTGVGKATLLNLVNKMGEELVNLALEGLDRISDEDSARTVNGCPRLECLNLRGSTKAGAKTAEAIRNCLNLKTLNLNYTNVPPSSLGDIAVSCTQLEVLKVAALPKFTDHVLVNLTKQVKAAHLAVEDNSPNLPLAKLTSLKLRLTSITGAHIHELLALTPRLSRLDLSFTKVRRLASSGLDNLAIPPLEKLVLTSTPVDIAELLAIISDLPRLKKLHLGGLGAQQGRNQEVSALTLTDARLMELTDVLSENCLEIEDINLAQNAKLGSRFGSRTHADALLFFVRQVGRYCKKLNLSGTSLRSSDLDGLLPVLLDPMPVMKNPNHVPSDPPRLEVIVLNNTKVDDEAAEALSACKNLEILELSGTSMLKEGLFRIIDECTKLEKIDLTSCRGVKVTERRDFFRIWEDERNAG